MTHSTKNDSPAGASTGSETQATATTGTQIGSSPDTAMVAGLVTRPFIQSEIPPKLDAIPIRVSPLTLTWRGKYLAVASSIQYVAEDGGHQNGRILILASGPRSLVAYPDGVLSANPRSASFLNVDRGETFSVRRVRPIAANLGPIENRAAVEEVQVLILNEKNQLLLVERSKTSAAKAAGAGKETNGPAF